MTNLTSPFPATPHKLGLYPVVDSVEWIARLLEAGVTTIQLRIKDLPDEQVEADIAAAIALGKRYQARLFINDYWRLAIKHGAYGVHLGQEDLDTTDLGGHPSGRTALGVSTHDDAELARAIAVKPSYIALGISSQRKPRRCPLSRKAWPSCNATSPDYSSIQQ